MKNSIKDKNGLMKLEISDIRQIIENKKISMDTMLDKMTPEVAKMAINQFPVLADTIKDNFSGLVNIFEKSLDENSKNVSSCYETCDEIILSCQNELKNEKYSFEEKIQILKYMPEIVKLMHDIHKDSQKDNAVIRLEGLVGLVVVACVLLTAIGGNTKISIS